MKARRKQHLEDEIEDGPVDNTSSADEEDEETTYAEYEDYDELSQNTTSGNKFFQACT